jgi:hypothetical protein
LHPVPPALLSLVPSMAAADVLPNRKKMLADLLRNAIAESPPRGVPMTRDPEVACMH